MGGSHELGKTVRTRACRADTDRPAHLKSRPMNFTNMLRDATARNTSLLCVGLDPEPTRFPAGMQGDAHKIYDFCAAIVDATADLVCAFKPQIAYFAAHGAEDQLERLMQHMRCNAPHVPVIFGCQTRRHRLHRRAIRQGSI